MPTKPLFSSDEATATSRVTVQFEDRSLSVPTGISVAAALLLNGVEPFRTTPVSAAPRAAYCMMGVCFECLVEVDGMPSRQACLTPVKDGMVVRRQHGASAVALPEAGEDHGR
ncbi:(2Fe-2S)-binding protein [Pigmentiphaga aceris]|uniref:(2Fe-2S)-binding protein n=1 Tax=Pigmentiphaga aceris TaxID=1940612 RepID=A0A5C0AYE6_9BURK|nr:(2Fe-2S)-binding protein [Pigmentiphaga aceris]QEI07428.1 (2Fe-2S)-binding protein [Pigmentiphaga aceris]